MARKVYRWDGTQMVEVSQDYEPQARVEINCDPNFQEKHPIDGRVFTSKRDFRQWTKDHGCVEVGDQHMRPQKSAYTPDREGIRQSLRDALQKLSGGR